MLKSCLDKRRGRQISDEDVRVYMLGFDDACEAMRSDEVRRAISMMQFFSHSAIVDSAIHMASRYVEEYED